MQNFFTRFGFGKTPKVPTIVKVTQGAQVVGAVAFAATMLLQLNDAARSFFRESKEANDAVKKSASATTVKDAE